MVLLLDRSHKRRFARGADACGRWGLPPRNLVGAGTAMRHSRSTVDRAEARTTRMKQEDKDGKPQS
jgi:hypothetical protein